MNKTEYEHRKKFIEDVGKCFSKVDENNYWFEFMKADDFSDEKLLSFFRKTKYPGDPNDLLTAINQGYTVATYLSGLIDKLPSIVLNNFEFIKMLPEELFNEIIESMENDINKKRLISNYKNRNN